MLVCTCLYVRVQLHYTHNGIPSFLPVKYTCALLLLNLLAVYLHKTLLYGNNSNKNARARYDLTTNAHNICDVRLKVNTYLLFINMCSRPFTKTPISNFKKTLQIILYNLRFLLMKSLV